MKHSIAQNIDRGYKVGFKGVYMSWTCFPDVSLYHVNFLSFRFFPFWVFSFPDQCLLLIFNCFMYFCNNKKKKKKKKKRKKKKKKERRFNDNFFKAVFIISHVTQLKQFRKFEF